MTDDTNALSESESKYFETQGQADLTIPAAEAEKPVEGDVTEKVEAKPEEAKPTEIEVIDEADADSAEPDARKYIKVGVLRKEREKSKNFRQQLEAAQQQIASLQRPQEQPRQLQPEEVPQAALERVQNLERTLAERDARQQFVTTYAQKAQEFTKDNADFPEAYSHALNLRRSMYETAGYGPQQVAQLLESEEAAIVEKAMIDGENPAKRIYDIAKLYGYQPKAKAGNTEARKDMAEQKREALQNETADKTLEAAKKLEKIAKGMDKNKSLAGSGGGNDAPSLEELVMMDDTAFEKATSGKKFQELMGG